MTKRSAFEARPSRLTSWKLRFSAHTVLMLASSISLLISAIIFQQRLEEIRETRTDNGGWIVSQLEVDHLDLLNTLDNVALKGGLEGYAPVSAADFSKITENFDIFYSRVDVFASSLRRFAISPDLRRQISDLKQVRDELTREIDGIEVVDRQAIMEFRTSVMAARSLVRSTTLAALQELSADETRANNEEAQLFVRFFVQSIILFVLLALGSFLVIRLWRELDAKTNETARIAAILSTAFDATLNGVIVTNDDMRLLYSNDMSQQIFNFGNDTQRGRSLQDLIVISVPGTGEAPDKEVPLTKTYVETLLGQGPKNGFCLRADGTRVPVEILMIEDEDISGQMIIVGFIRDISDRVKAEENWRNAVQQANQAANAKSMFLATMSHEMRTPLHGLMASLALIDDTLLDEKTLALIKTSRDCSARALMQVDDVLELTRLGDSRETSQHFPVVRIASAIVEELQPLARKSNNHIELIQKGPFEEYTLSGLPVSFSRTLYNLTGNAVKFTENGLITIRLTLQVAEDGISLMVEVEDTGIGIKKADQARIFENFETADRSEINSNMGSGLGLPIAKLAIEQQGGKLGVSSMVGVGSRFYFTIPVKSLTDDNAVTLDAEADAEGTALEVDAKRVLVVEDNEVNLTLMTEMVRRMGHTPDMAKNGKEAVKKANDTAYDVILLDFSMPVMDGPTAARHIRNEDCKSCSAVIIGVTALIEAKAGEGGGVLMDEVLIKPVAIPKLSRAIDRTFHDRLAMLERSQALELSEDPSDNDLEPNDFAETSESTPDQTFSDLCEMVGEPTAVRLVHTTLEDARIAIESMSISTLDLVEKAEIIHKAVGSTGLLGFIDLSELLVEAEIMAKEGHDPGMSHLPEWAERQLKETEALYANVIASQASLTEA